MENNYGKAFIYFPDGQSIVLENITLCANGNGRFSINTHAHVDTPFDCPITWFDEKQVAQEIPRYWW